MCDAINARAAFLGYYVFSMLLGTIGGGPWCRKNLCVTYSGTYAVMRKRGESLMPVLGADSHTRGSSDYPSSRVLAYFSSVFGRRFLQQQSGSAGTLARCNKAAQIHAPASTW